MADEKEINELLDRLLEGCNAEQVVGEGGLLPDLTKRFMERVLEAELTDHLDYDKHPLESMYPLAVGSLRKGRTAPGVTPARAYRPDEDIWRIWHHISIAHRPMTTIFYFLFSVS